VLVLLNLPCAFWWHASALGGMHWWHASALARSSPKRGGAGNWAVFFVEIGQFVEKEETN